MNASSFGIFPTDRLMLGDRLTQVTAGSGSTVKVKLLSSKTFHIFGDLYMCNYVCPTSVVVKL